MFDTQTIQLILLAVAAFVAYPVLKEKFLAMKGSIPSVTPSTPIVADGKQKFAELVKGWESFLAIIESNKMQECAEDMKTLLIKMAVEYRSDLNEDDDEQTEIDVILKDKV